jgi:hypothetical protein
MEEKKEDIVLLQSLAKKWKMKEQKKRAVDIVPHDLELQLLMMQKMKERYEQQQYVCLMEFLMLLEQKVHLHRVEWQTQFL